MPVIIRGPEGNGFFLEAAIMKFDEAQRKWDYADNIDPHGVGSWLYDGKTCTLSVTFNEKANGELVE